MSISDSKSASVKCQLREPTLTCMQGRRQLVPLSSHRGRISTEGLVEQILNQGTTVRGADVKAVLDNLGRAIFALCSKGEAVSIDNLGIITPQVGGLANADGTWAEGPYVYLNMRFESSLSTAIQDKTPIEIVQAKTTVPTIAAVRDAASGTENETLTANGSAGISGMDLRFNPTKADEGIYLVPAEGEIVKVSQILDNELTRLTFNVPAGIQPGTAYSVEVRTRVRGTKQLRRSNWPKTMLGV